MEILVPQAGKGAGSPVIDAPQARVSIDSVFYALGDPTRRAIVGMLSQRPHSVSNLAAPLNISLTAVVQHLQVLEEAGLIRTEKTGRVRTAQIESAGFTALERWIFKHKIPWQYHLDRLGELLGEE